MRGPRKLAIVGGGITGLSSGIYAQLHGFRTTIYEKNSVPGGSCMSWTRNHLPLEGSMRLFAGAQPGSRLHACWEEVGALEDTLFVSPDSLLTVEHSGATVIFSQSLEEFYECAAKLSPEDAKLLQRFCEVVRRLEAYELPVEKPAELPLPLKLLHPGEQGSAAVDAAHLLARLRAVPLQGFARQFSHPALQCAFEQALPAGCTLGDFALLYAKFLTGDSAVPLGGSRRLIDRMVSFYLENGGELKLQTPVQEIIAANGSARGVLLENGEHRLAHWVIAACDPAYTCRVLLQDRFSMEKKLQTRYFQPEVYPTFSLVRLFFSAPAENLPPIRTLSFETDSIPAAGGAVDRLKVTQYGDDPLFVQNGRVELVADVPMPGRRAFQYWEQLFAQDSRYQAEVNRLAAAVQRALEKRFPEAAGKLQLLDCHTPMTYAARLHAYQGACGTFLRTAKARTAPLTGRLPGLNHFFMAGQWLADTPGMHAALLQGKFVLQRICHEERLDW